MNINDEFCPCCGQLKTIGFGSRLRRIREHRDLTQLEMAQELGVTRAAYSRYENETSEPNFENLVRICEKLEITPDWLLGYKHEQEAEDEHC